MDSTWIVVAHEAGARFFENDGRGTGLELVEEIEHADGRARDRDMASDRPGRSFRKNSGNPSRASMGQSEGPATTGRFPTSREPWPTNSKMAACRIDTSAWCSLRRPGSWVCCGLPSTVPRLSS